MKTARVKQLLTPFLALTCFLGAFLIAGNLPVRGQDPAIPAIQMQDVELTSVIANLGRQADLNLILDPKLSGPSYGPDGKYLPPPRVSFRWENVSAKNALARVLAEHGLCAVESPASSVTRIMFTNQAANFTYFADKVWIASGTNVVVPVIQMEHAPLDRALAELVKQAQLNVVLDAKLSNPTFVPGKPPSPRPTVTMRWHNLTARQAIAALCENFDLVTSQDADTGGLRISPGSSQGNEIVAPPPGKTNR